jgi:hypothetical protein
MIVRLSMCVFIHTQRAGVKDFLSLGQEAPLGSPERGCGMAAMGRHTLSRRRDRIVGKVTEDQLHFESVNTTRAAVTGTCEHNVAVFTPLLAPTYGMSSALTCLVISLILASVENLHSLESLRDS